MQMWEAWKKTHEQKKDDTGRLFELEKSNNDFKNQLDEANTKLSEMEALQNQLAEVNVKLSEMETLQNQLAEANAKLSEMKGSENNGIQ